MTFRLSPPIDPELKDKVRRLKYQVITHAEQTYVKYQEGHDGCIDFLALEEPLIKKRIQRQEQRKRKMLLHGPLTLKEYVNPEEYPTCLPRKMLLHGPLTLEETLARYVVELWFECKEEFISNLILRDGLTKSSMGWRNHTPKKKKDRLPSLVTVTQRLSVEKNANAQTISLFEDEMIHVPDELRPAFNMVTPEDVDHAKRTRPKMHRASNLGNGRGARPLPVGMKWKWDNGAGYIVTKK
jgi:hypothetical protein